jgi:hypothetical protein
MSADSQKQKERYWMAFVTQRSLNRRRSALENSWALRRGRLRKMGHQIHGGSLVIPALFFEDYVDAQEGSIFNVRKARQASSHPMWIRKNVSACGREINIIPVLVTSVTRVANGATPHINELVLWLLKDFYRVGNKSSRNNSGAARLFCGTRRPCLESGCDQDVRG